MPKFRLESKDRVESAGFHVHVELRRSIAGQYGSDTLATMEFNLPVDTERNLGTEVLVEALTHLRDSFEKLYGPINPPYVEVAEEHEAPLEVVPPF